MKPAGADISMAGIKSDHIEAATITPAAKPKRTLFIKGLILSFMKKTQADPKTVPITGIPNPAIIPFILELCENHAKLQKHKK